MLYNMDSILTKREGRSPDTLDEVEWAAIEMSYFARFLIGAWLLFVVSLIGAFLYAAWYLWTIPI